VYWIPTECKKDIFDLSNVSVMYALVLVKFEQCMCVCVMENNTFCIWYFVWEDQSAEECFIGYKIARVLCHQYRTVMQQI